MEQFSMKELYDVSLKTTYPMRIGNRDIEVGEKIAIFDKIQLANFNEIKQYKTANGGYDNRARVFWEDTKEIRLNFTQGVFSKEQMSLMLNAKLINGQSAKNPLLISKREILESSEISTVELKYKPQNLFVYDAATSEKINYEKISDTVIKISQPYMNIIVDYQYE